MADNIKLTQEQLNEIDSSYNLFAAGKISSEEYIQTCTKYGIRPIDKRTEPVYKDGDNSSRVGFKWCCYNHPKGKYFQNVIKILIRNTLTSVHSLIVEKDKDGNIGNYKDSRLTFLDKFAKDFIKYRMGNHDGGIQYKKDLSNQAADILLWYANNDTNFRTKMLTMINTFSDKKTLFQLTPPEEYNNKKFG
jgi:hypothetical protein